MHMNEEKIQEVIIQVEEKITPKLHSINKLVELNTAKVLSAFQHFKVSESHLMPSTGYGYDDIGRDTLEKIYSFVFGGESALVRTQIISGTHAIAICLFGILRPFDELLYITGKPYDTLEEIVGIRGNGIGSFKEFQIGYKAIPLKNQKIDYQKIKQAITEKTKMIGIQRSCGYENRPSFSIAEIGEMVNFIKEINPNLTIFVDNCYGEFVEDREPLSVGADLIAGSLIKNPGGGLAKTGGYIVGKADLVTKCSYRLSAPGIGAEVGASLNSLPEMYQGFFIAPHTVGEALKGAIFTSALLEELNFSVRPRWFDVRSDLVQAITFNDKAKMIKFCQEIQYCSPINSHVTPLASYMPGYSDDVIMGAGTFVQGASIELTADGAVRQPFTAYVQGGLSYAHVKLAVSRAALALFSHK